MTVLDVVLIAALAALLLYQSLRLQRVEKRLEQADACLDDLRVSMARIEAQLQSALKENNASRTAVRRVEDFLLHAKRRSHDDSQF
jgi:hypothetical protein